MATRTIERYDYLTAVRGLAIILVIIIHVSQKIENLPLPFFKYCSRGVYGVQMFFIASAITIFISYTRRKRLNEKNLKLNFFIRRFFRIAPMYYLAAIFYCFYYYFNPSFFDQPFNFLKVIPSILFINGLFPGAVNYIPPGGWSIGVEMAFYCLIPYLIIKITSVKKAIQLFFILFAITLLIKFIARAIMVYYLHINYHGPESWTLYFWFPNQVVVFSLGLIIYFTKPYIELKKFGLGAVVVACSTFLMFAIFYIKDTYDQYFLIPEHVLIAVLLSLIIYVMSRVKLSLLENVLTRFLGKISFSLYLVHFAVINLVRKSLPIITNSYLDFFVTLVSVIIIGSLISWVTYRIIEKKGIAFGEKLINKRFNSTESDCRG